MKRYRAVTPKASQNFSRTTPPPAWKYFDPHAQLELGFTRNRDFTPYLMGLTAEDAASGYVRFMPGENVDMNESLLKVTARFPTRLSHLYEQYDQCTEIH